MNMKSQIRRCCNVGLALTLPMTSVNSAISKEAGPVETLDIVQIADRCDHDNAFPHNRVSHTCLETLHTYFMDKPIWEVSGRLSYYTGKKSRSSGPAINGRSRYLPFARADYMLDEVPTWSDIFDGRMDDRHDIVLQVFRDDACRALARRGGIQPELAQRCHAKELFKYATHLDACLTGFERNMLLMNPQRTDGKSVFQNSIDEITRRGGAGLDVRVAMLAELHMHALWMTGVCISLPATAFDDDLQSMQLGNLGNSDFSIAEFSIIMEKGHDAALGIAARSGDEWAIQSYYPPHPRRDPDYWQAMQRINPLLLHRWMASFVGGMVLSDEERMWHAVKAYSIERETFPDSRLADHVVAIKEGRIPLDQMLRDHASLKGDAQMSLDDKALRRIADATLLKYPW